MANELFTTVVLDAPRRIRFRPGVARYRFGEIKKPLNLDALKNGKTFTRALCQWLYACMDEDCGLDSPEAIAEAIQDKTPDQLIEIGRTLVDCIGMYKTPASEKNGSGSTQQPSPGSS